MIKDLRSAYAFCKEDISLIENYDKAIADESNNWVIHHKLGIAEDYQNTKDELMMMNLYFHRPASELIFMTKSEHIKLHNKARIKEIVKTLSEANRNRVWTQESKDKISKALTGRKLGPMSDEHKKKISMARMGKHYPRKKEVE